MSFLFISYVIICSLLITLSLLRTNSDNTSEMRNNTIEIFKFSNSEIFTIGVLLILFVQLSIQYIKDI